MSATKSSQSALAHLKRLKPLDGWALDFKSNTVRLLRRNVPVSETYFLGLHVTPQNQVVGILTESKNGQAQGQALVDEKRNLVKSVSIVSVKDWKKTTETAHASSTARSNFSSSNASNNSSIPFSPDENKQLLQYAAIAVGAAIFLKILLSSLSGLLILILPAAYVYCVLNCPSEDSFDIKQQLKRVMRGQHLPETHPDKPKGFFSETLARFQATVATELSTSLGYNLNMINVINAALVANVHVPSIEREFYWLGVNNHWYYLFSSSTSSTARPTRSV
ncbi:hypothetical protein MPSEU_001102800 [Mayamaea pseudoterrestris]|nr:hypothetical protein MPSEU_001102800 [Mayamaea pseudoterrestris]